MMKQVVEIAKQKSSEIGFKSSIRYLHLAILQVRFKN